MSINNKIIIGVSILAIILIVCLKLFSPTDVKASYEGMAAYPISEYKININTATVSELVRCNGMGEKTAQAIIDYRNENGNFKSVDDITNVKGIGEKKLNLWKELLCVE